MDLIQNLNKSFENIDEQKVKAKDEQIQTLKGELEIANDKLAEKEKEVA